MNKEFSPNENRILDILGKRKLTINIITERMYRVNPPLSANTTVSNAIRRINFKCERLKKTWFINGEGMGRGGKTVWRDKR